LHKQVTFQLSSVWCLMFGCRYLPVEARLVGSVTSRILYNCAGRMGHSLVILRKLSVKWSVMGARSGQRNLPCWRRKHVTSETTLRKFHFCPRPGRGFFSSDWTKLGQNLHKQITLQFSCHAACSETASTDRKLVE